MLPDGSRVFLMYYPAWSPFQAWLNFSTKEGLLGSWSYRHRPLKWSIIILNIIVKNEPAIILVRDHFERSFCFFHFFSPGRDHFADHLCFHFFSPSRDHFTDNFGGALFWNKHLSAMYFLFSLSQSELAHGWWDNLDRWTSEVKINLAPIN